MQKEDIKFKDSCVFEGMTSIRAIIRSIDNKTSNRRILKILFDKNKIKKISKEVGYFKAVSDKYGFELIEADTQELAELTLGSSHGGIIAITSERTFPALSADISLPSDGFFVMIQGIEDPYNFGYALRSLYIVSLSIIAFLVPSIYISYSSFSLSMSKSLISGYTSKASS